MKKTGFYIIKDKFFEDMTDPYLKGNKAGNRPHYYCFEDTNTGIYWMIPLSSRIDKYRRIMEKKEKAGKFCDEFLIKTTVYAALMDEETDLYLESREAVLDILKEELAGSPYRLLEI